MRKSELFAAAVIAALSAAGAAQAGPREDVLAGAIRCGGVGQDRQWLDCYYGAAQPMRAQLRLTPAPQAQQAIGGAQGGMAGVRQDVLSGAIRCGGVADDRQWLDCYYGSAQPMRAQLGLSPAPQAQLAVRPARPAQALAPLPPAPYAPRMASAAPPPSRPAAARMPPSPGFIDGLFGDDPVVTKSKIATLTTDRAGYFTATLDNGQVWRQTSGDIANFKRDPASYNVTVTRGMLRTFNFRVEGDPKHYKVKPGRTS